MDDSPALVKERLELERAGRPFLLLGPQPVALDGDRVTIGRNPECSLTLSEDEEVSRLHAELERIGGEWTISDDGLSRNGTFVNGRRISGRCRLRDGDVIRVGATTIDFRAPEAEAPMATRVGEAPVSRDGLPITQRQVLVALARPYKHTEYATPAGNAEIAAELHLSVDAVKAHLRQLFQRFGLEDEPQNRKRARLVAEALQSGVVSRREL